MIYDCINGEQTGEVNVKFWTIGDLIKCAQENPDKSFTFIGTNRTVDKLGSWRGSYDLPSISPKYNELGSEGKKGQQIAEELVAALKLEHHGYKGGLYKYGDWEEFYVAEHGSSREYKVVGATIEENSVILLTKLDPY